MMDDNVISFTKLGTVKSKYFDECTYSNFFDRMRDLIKKDVSHYQVIHEGKKYTIIYKGNKYKVNYGDEVLNDDCKRRDVVDSLYWLASLSRDKKREYDNESEREENERNELRRIIRNAERGIFINADDKEKYIEYLKNEDKKDSFFKRLFRRLKKNFLYNDYDPDDVYLRFIIDGVFGLSLLSLYFSLALARIPAMVLHTLFNFLGIFLISDFAYAGIMHLIYIFSYKFQVDGKWWGPIGIPWTLINLPYHLAKTSIEKFREKKTIKALESSLRKDNKKLGREPKINKQQLEALQKQFSEEKEVKQEHLKDETMKIVDDTSRIFGRLHKKVKNIENKKAKEEKSKELLVIVNDYMAKSVEFFVNGIDRKYQVDVENKIQTLEYKIDEILEAEEKERKDKEEFTQTLHEINQTIQYRSGGR